jgi:hypothetical protein
MAGTNAAQSCSLYSSHDGSRLLGFRYVFLYTILDNSFSTLLDFKGTLPTLHRLEWVAGVLPVTIVTESLILWSKGYCE